MATKTINITYTETSSVAFNAPVQRVTLLDASNQSFLRQVMVSNDGIKVIRGSNAVQIPMGQLFAAAFAAFPSMSWAPIVATQPTASQDVFPATISMETASLTFGVTDEFTTDLNYQWYVSSSLSSGAWTLPTESAYVHYEGTASLNLSASTFAGGAAKYYFACSASNPAGGVLSTVGKVNILP